MSGISLVGRIFLKIDYQVFFAVVYLFIFEKPPIYPGSSLTPEDSPQLLRDCIWAEVLS